MRTRPDGIRALVERCFAPAVLVAGALGLAGPGPGRFLVRYDAIPILLFLLVLGSALGVEPGITGRVGFVVATTCAALLVARLVDPSARPAVILSVAVRDFAVASGLATAAFGPKAAGPVGIYGVVVIASGAGLVRWLRPNPEAPASATP